MRTTELDERALLEQTATVIGGWLTNMYAGLSELAMVTQKEILSSTRTTPRRNRVSLTPRERKEIRVASEIFLRDHPTPEAAGIIVGPGIFSDEGEIEWWKLEDDGTTTRVLFTLTPQSAGYYDFETLEWFRSAVDTGRPTFTGPYLDYAGMDEYILTLTVPVHLHGDIVGVAGCDIQSVAVERELMPALRRLRGDVALVSAHDRIILGNSGRFLVGNRVGALPGGAVAVGVPAHDLGLSLVWVSRETF